MLTEIGRSLKSLGRQENKWLDASLPVVAYIRQLDPAKGKTRDHSLEAWTSRLNQAYVQAAQSLRRAASLCDSDGHDESYGDTMASSYLAEADQAAANMFSMIASALDRVAYLKQGLPERQAQRIAAAVAERPRDAHEIPEEDAKKDDAVHPVDPTVSLATSASRAAR
jgi:hypothetical protein